MKSAFSLILVVAALFLVASCSSDSTTATGTTASSTAGGTGTSGTSMAANSVTGDGYFLDGTWEGCSTQNSADYLERRVVVGGTVTATAYFVNTTDGSCSGTLTEDTDSAGEFTGTGGTDFVTEGWSTGSSITIAPTALDGTTTIDDPATATSFDISGTFGGTAFTGEVMNVFIDDSDPTVDVIWYRAANNPSNPCDASGVGDDEDCLQVNDYLVLQ